MTKSKNVYRLALCAMLFALCCPVHAQQQGKVFRIGYLSSQSHSADAARLNGFRQVLHDLGYVEGKNIVIDYRFAEGKFDRFPDLAADLVKRKVEVIVTTGTPPTRAAQQATRTIPVVMTVVGEPVEAGFVASLAKPGGNITGLTQMVRQLSGKRLELLKEAFPKISRVAAFVDKDTVAEALQETELVAEALGIKLQSIKIGSFD